jgi:hypothetical protein
LYWPPTTMSTVKSSAICLTCRWVKS